MRLIYKVIFSIIVFIVLGTIVIAQSDEDTGECNVYIREAMVSIENQCDGIDSNEACYGKSDITAINHAGETVTNFSPALAERYIGLPTIQSMTLAELDDENDIWGISLLSILTNTPITGTAREVKLVLFGGVDLKNSVDDVKMVDGVVNSDGVVNLRTGPAAKNGSLDLLEPETELTLLGRIASGDWLRIQVKETGKIGWIQADYVHTDESVDLLELTIMSPSAPYYSSMQAFTYTSNSNAVGCSDMPTNGLLMQTPEGGAVVTMSMNGVTISMQGTAFAQASEDGEMTISMLEGNGTVTSGGQTVPIFAGTEVTVSLDGLIGVGGPSDPSTMDDNLQDLPGELTGDIVISDPLDQDTINTLLDDYYDTGDDTTTMTDGTNTGGNTDTNGDTGDGTGNTPTDGEDCDGNQGQGQGQGNCDDNNAGGIGGGTGGGQENNPK